jgi:hypothetical protein
MKEAANNIEFGEAEKFRVNAYDERCDRIKHLQDKMLGR